MTINLYFAIFLVVLLMLIIPTVLVVFLKKHQRILKVILLILFIAYIILLFIGTMSEISVSNNTLNISLNFSNEWFSSYFHWFDVSKTNVLINLFLLFPIGFVTYSFCKKRKFLKTVLLALFISIIIETLQFVLPVVRNTEPSDIIFNTLSGIISAGYCSLLTKFGAFKNTII